MRATWIALLLPFLTQLASAQDWPMFRGPSGNGIGPANRVRTHWSATERVKWKVPLPRPANGSPIVSNGVVFVTVAEDEEGKRRSLYAFDRQDGRELWHRTVSIGEAMPTHGTNPYGGSTPAADGERVVVWHGSAGLHAYDFAGEPLWSRDLGTFRHRWGYGTSPVIHDGKVLLHTGPGAQPFVTAIDLGTGATLWRQDEPIEGDGQDLPDGRLQGSWCTPLVHEHGGRWQVLCTMPTRLVSYDSRTGDVLWFAEGLVCERGALVYSSPSIAEDSCLILGGYDGPEIAVRLDEARGNVTDSHVLWRHPRRPSNCGSGVVVGGHLYLPDMRGNLVCLDPETGERLWSERALPGAIWSSIVSVGPYLYVTNQDGTTIVFRPDPEKLDVVARNELGETTNATPAFSNGEIFLRTHESLVCIEAPEADLVLRGGRVWRGRDLDETTAIAIAGEEVIAVGDDGVIEPYVRATTRVVELQDRRVVPGFVDAHVHLLGGGDELLGRDLRYAPTMEAFAKGLAELAATRPKGSWITAATWDHERWPGTPLPHRGVIDPLVSEHPVLVSRTDGHMAVANSLALRIAGVTKDTPDPPGGTIVRDEDGEPTGVLKDAAMNLVALKIPSWNHEERRERILAALDHAASLGVTWMHDMGMERATWETLRRMRQAGELTCRLTGYVPRDTFLDFLERQENDGDALLNRRGFKAFVDGSLGSTTAWFFEPYVDAPDTTGLTLIDTGEGGTLERSVTRAIAANLQPAVHAIGDRANHELLDLYQRAGSKAARCRIEHAQHLLRADIARFSELGVIASMQPYHAVDDGRWCETRIGAERSKTTYAFRSLLDASAHLAFGSDWPVAPLSPLLGIHAAVTRATLDGAHPEGWVPEEKITVREALVAYTEGGAWAGGGEGRLGRLEPGALADLVVLDRDLLTIEPKAIAEVRVDLTIVNGAIVHERE